MNYSNEHKTECYIFSGYVANELLRRGSRITHVKADKKNKQRSVFLFKVENNIERAIDSITEQMN